MAVPISKQAARQFILGKQGLWPGRRGTTGRLPETYLSGPLARLTVGLAAIVRA